MKTDMFFFETIGTSDLSNYFYGHVDLDCGSKIETWYKRTCHTIVEFLNRPKVTIMSSFGMTVGKTILYYLG